MLSAPIIFGRYRLDPGDGLTCGGHEVRLTPKALAVLCILTARAGRVISKAELFDAAWPDRVVGDATMVSCIQELRQALGDDARRPRYIETLHRRGYRWIAGAHPAPPALVSDGSALPQDQPVAPSANADGVRAAAAERRQLTIMFVDLVGSTALSAHLDPEDMSELIQGYEACCSALVEVWGGHITKLMGDGILACFGWPTAHEDAAERAVRAGLAIAEAVAGLATPTGEPLTARIGIATGVVVVGNLSSEGRADREAVVGEAPNLASRLQTLAAGGRVLISDATRGLLGALFEFADRGRHHLKGFSEPVQVWEVTGASQVESRFDAQHGDHLAPLIGRDQELDLLSERWRRSKDGEGQVVLLGGEPGIGKSRLVRALRERQATDAYTALSHYCSPFHTNTALYPVINLLERAAGFATGDAAAQKRAKLAIVLQAGTAALNEALALIGPMLGIDVAVESWLQSMTAEEKKRRILDLLVEQLATLAGKRPVLIIYEDVHWIDPTTLELLGEVVERVQSVPALLIITYRPEFTPPWLALPHVMQLSLSRLTRRHGEDLVRQVAGEEHLPAGLLTQIVESADGVPLFVEELTRSILESEGIGQWSDDTEHVVRSRQVSLPSSLHDSLMMRLDRLGSGREIAQVGAVIGRHFTRSLLQTVLSDWSSAGLQAALDQLTASGLVWVRQTQMAVTYVFKHALVQEAAYQSLLRARRHMLHARIAENMEQGQRGDEAAQPEIIAHHLTQADLFERAIPYWRKAGAEAIQRSANIEAVAHLNEGLTLIQKVPASSARDHLELAVQLDLTVPLIAVHGFGSSEVERCAARAHWLAGQLGNAAQQFTATRVVWNSSLMRRPVPDTIALANELLARAEEIRGPAHRAVAARALAYSLLISGQPAEALAQFRQGYELADQLGGSDFRSYGEHPSVVCRFYGAWCCCLVGKFAEGRALGEQAIDIARDLNDMHLVAWALACLGYTVVLLRDGAAACAVGEEGLALAAEHRLPQWIGFNREIRAWGRLLTGNLKDAIREMRESDSQIRATGARLHTSRSATFLADGCLRLGSLDDARRHLEHAREHWRRYGEAYVGAEIERLEALLLAAEQAPEAMVIAALKRAMTTARAQGARLFELRACIDLARLHRQDADHALADCLAHLHGQPDTPDTIDARNMLLG